MIAGSLVNAVLDLFRKDEEPVAQYDLADDDLATTGSARRTAKKAARSSAFFSAITTLILNEVRKQAIEYARRELRNRIPNARGASASTYRYDSSGRSENGDHRDVA
jgi:hypothetical protein